MATIESRGGATAAPATEPVIINGASYDYVVANVKMNTPLDDFERTVVYPPIDDPNLTADLKKTMEPDGEMIGGESDCTEFGFDNYTAKRSLAPAVLMQHVAGILERNNSILVVEDTLKHNELNALSQRTSLGQLVVAAAERQTADIAA